MDALVVEPDRIPVVRLFYTITSRREDLSIGEGILDIVAEIHDQMDSE